MTASSRNTAAKVTTPMTMARIRDASSGLQQGPNDVGRVDAVLLDALHDLRPHARGPVLAEDLAVLVGPALLELEDVLLRDDGRLHARDLGDARDAALAVRAAR